MLPVLVVTKAKFFQFLNKLAPNVQPNILLMLIQIDAKVQTGHQLSHQQTKNDITPIWIIQIG